MLQFDFESSIGYWVCSTSHALRRALNNELAREKITFRQWEVLAWMALQGQTTQSELAERLGIEAPTLAGILSRMERDGWIIREACPGDRRKKLLRATPQADAVWVRMVECCHRVRAAATAGLSGDDLAQFKGLCEKIRENLGAAGLVDEPCAMVAASVQPAEVAVESC